MGGDGGTISSNRTYLRGAGKACHTADHPSNAAKRAKLEDTDRARLILTTCAISGAVLDLTPSKNKSTNGARVGSCSGADIVVCPYGKLYKREEALEALLRRSQQINNNNTLGSHVRGMKDLHPVRFYVTAATASNGGNHNNTNGTTKARYSATCPITSADIGSGNVPSFVIVRSSKNEKSKDKKNESSTNDDTQEFVELGPNVISERAIKEMGIDSLQSEYGPFEEKNMIRLAPPKAGGVFEDIQRRWEARVEEERAVKMQKKKDKKRKRNTTEEVSSKKTIETIASLPVGASAAAAAAASIHVKKSSVADEARANIQMKVGQNPVLSSLFGGKKNQSEKEKRDALFTRNC